MENKLLIVKLSEYKIEMLQAFCREENLTIEQVVGTWINSLHQQIALKDSAASVLYDNMIAEMREYK